MGVTCFTEDCTNLLMWSHYAENHTGFCLEFDASNEFFSNVRKVDYIQSPTVVSARSLLCSTNLQRWDTIESIVCTKAECWSYQKEWRLLSRQAKVAKAYAASALKAVYLGTKVSDVNKGKIAGAVSGQVAPYQMRRMETSFGFSSELIRQHS